MVGAILATSYGFSSRGEANSPSFSMQKRANLMLMGSVLGFFTRKVPPFWWTERRKVKARGARIEISLALIRVEKE